MFTITTCDKLHWTVIMVFTNLTEYCERNLIQIDTNANQAILTQHHNIEANHLEVQRSNLK